MRHAYRIPKALGEPIPGAAGNKATVYIQQSEKSVVIGHCIYCGTSGRRGELTREHSIPYGLFGIATLGDASCDDCARETQRLEQRVLRDWFGPAREYLAFPTRKAKKDSRWTGEANTFTLEGALADTRKVEEAGVFLPLTFPNYLPRDLTPSSSPNAYDKRSLMLIPLSAPERTDQNYSNWYKFNATDLERVVAKIAYCEAIRLVDPALKDQRLARFVLGQESESCDFIGAKTGEKPTDTIHEVSFSRLAERRPPWRKFLLCNVRLFSFLPTPTYQVLIRENAEARVES